MTTSPVLTGQAGVWQEIQVGLVAAADYANPYTDVDVWADFVPADGGNAIRRPAFFDGQRSWKIRFAAPTAGRWSFTTAASVDDAGLAGVTGDVQVDAAATTGHRFYDRGFWRMSEGGLSLVHADGTPAVLVADTPWGLPWRGTVEQVQVYAADRHAKGFNAVLLMSVQPDQGAEGPRDRTEDHGFGRGFEDLPQGHINDLNVDYFQYLDALVDVLVEQQIVPVWQPVFQGFGWKGLGVAGVVVPPAEYARYCRYLVARYGARPAIYLVGADGSGEEPQIAAGGIEVQEWDAYAQPTGIHYRPFARNRAHQDAPWLDFQWCQTGHTGEHIPERVIDMTRNLPRKAVANGEPSYENTRDTGFAGGWWQGHEAWSNICAGGLMGVVYGAGSLWQWRLHADEPGHSDYFNAPGAGWREAIDFPGSAYVGLVNQILDGMPITDAEPDWLWSMCPRGISVPGQIYLAYSEFGGDLRIKGDGVPRHYRVFDPQTGALVAEGDRDDEWALVPDPGGAPRVFVLQHTT